MRSLPVLLILPVLLVPSRPADACSAPVCWPGAFVPGDGSTIPQNAPGLYWRPTTGGGAAPDPSSVTLTAAGAPDTALPFTATAVAGGDYVLVPDAPLVEGTSYVLDDRSSCGDVAGPRVTFTAGPSAPLPTSLGAVSAIGHGLRGELDIATGSGSCSTTIDATSLGIELAPSAEATPWMALLLFETVVDDQPWRIQESANVFPGPGESWQGRGRDLLFRICAPNPDASYPGLASGGHQVAFRAAIPGAPSMSTPELPIELMCDAPADPQPDRDDASGGCASTTPTSSALILVGLAALRGRRRGKPRR